jgi:hypothetical protein
MGIFLGRPQDPRNLAPVRFGAALPGHLLRYGGQAAGERLTTSIETLNETVTPSHGHLVAGV